MESLRSRAGRDISLSYMKNLDPRENQTLRDADGGGRSVIPISQARRLSAA